MIPFIAFATAVCFQQSRPERLHEGDFKLAIKVTIDDKPVEFPGTQPMMVASRILVPMRGVFEAMGATLTWDPAMQSITADRGKHHVVIILGHKNAEVDGAWVPLEQPAQTIHGRTMVPLRFLGKGLGADVDWHPADRTVAITTGE